MNISSFDAWAKVFAVKSSEYEFSVTTEYKLRERFRIYNNLPELSSIYNSVAFHIPPAEVKLDRPECVMKQVVVPQTPEQAELTRRLIQFAKNPRPEMLGLYHLTPEQAKIAKMLICTDVAKKMTLDLRMYDPKAQDHPQNKLSVCAGNVAKIYREFDKYKGTQLVFLDSGTPGGAGFNAYAELKRKLVEDYGIPAHEIAFVHDATSDTQKEALLEAFNEGRIRVMIGSTRKMGTGVNCQQLVAAMHSLDPTWNPAGMDQRSGRGARQGNVLSRLHNNNQVPHYIYCTEKSLDVFYFQLLATKQQFIDQVKSNRLGVRTFDELTSDSNALTYGQFIAALTGNPKLMESQKLMVTIAQLEMQRKAFYTEQYRIRYRHEFMIEELDKNKELLAGFKSDKAFLEKSPLPVVGDKKMHTFILEGHTYQDTEAFGLHLKSLVLQDTFFPVQPTVIGHYRGWDITAHHKAISMSRTGGKYSYNYQFNFAENDGYNCGRYPIHCLQRIDALIKKYEELIVQNKKNIDMLGVSMEVKPWPKEMELTDLKERKGQLEIEIESSEKKDSDKVFADLLPATETHKPYQSKKK
jgi:hypothetical protein